MYECKTDLEDIDGERFYYLWTHRGYIVYHWDKNAKQLDKISSKFFININDAQAYAREYANINDVKVQLAMKIKALQDELEAL